MNFFTIQSLGMAVLITWTFIWKFYSVWTAVKHGHKKWFVALILFNTLGILDMVYIFGVLKKKWPEVKATFLKAMSSTK